MQKSVLITGCSSGIGYDAAHTLLVRGWRVFATCRKETDCARLRDEGLESFVLDYEDEATISDALSQALSRTGGTLDAVFNNGAYAQPGAVEDIPRNAMRAIFEANFFGYQDVIRQVMPVMRRQGHGRIVNCSSILGLVAARYRGPYNATKFALEALTDTLRLEIVGSGIHPILIEPGPITTDIRKKARPQFERWIDWKNSAHNRVYEQSLIPRLYDEGTPDSFSLPPSAVTKKLIHALESRRPAPRYYVTTPTYMADVLRRVLPTRMLDRFLMKG